MLVWKRLFRCARKDGLGIVCAVCTDLSASLEVTQAERGEVTARKKGLLEPLYFTLSRHL